MLSRRTLLASAASALLAPTARAAAILTDDGMLPAALVSRQPCSSLPTISPKPLQKKKRFAVIWELRGCPYCKKMHEINFADAAIESYHQGAVRDPAAQHHRRARGDRFRRREAAPRSGSRRNTACATRRPSSSSPKTLAGLAQESAARARSRAHAGLYGAEALPCAVPFRRRARLRERPALPTS